MEKKDINLYPGTLSKWAIRPCSDLRQSVCQYAHPIAKEEESTQSAVVNILILHRHQYKDYRVQKAHGVRINCSWYRDADLLFFHKILFTDGNLFSRYGTISPTIKIIACWCRRSQILCMKRYTVRIGPIFLEGTLVGEK